MTVCRKAVNKQIGHEVRFLLLFVNVTFVMSNLSIKVTYIVSLFFSFARHKLIKWWCQSFLVCIPVVTCGFRNDHGIVNRLTDYPTAKLPSIGANFWLPNVCMNFLESFLTFSKATILDEDMLYKFWWDPSASEVHVVKPKHQDTNFVLPQWYKDEIFSA